MSRLIWDLQLALLKMYGVSTRRTTIERLVEELALVSRGLVGPVAEKDSLTGAIRAEWGGFLDEISLAVLHGALPEFGLFHANREIIRRVHVKDEVFGEVHDDVCEHLVKPACALVGKIAGFIEESIRFDEPKIRGFRLGRLVQEGIYPSDAYRRTARYPEEGTDPSAISWWLAHHDPAQGSHAGASRKSWWLANCDPTPREVVPEGTWFGEVQQRWAELDIPTTLPAWFSRIASGDAGETIVGVVEEIDATACAGLVALKRPPREDLEGRIICSRATMLRGMGFSDRYTGKLKKIEQQGKLKMKEALISKMAFRFTDHDHHPSMESQVAKLTRPAEPGSKAPENYKTHDIFLNINTQFEPASSAGYYPLRRRTPASVEARS